MKHKRNISKFEHGSSAEKDIYFTGCCNHLSTTTLQKDISLITISWVHCGCRTGCVACKQWHRLLIGRSVVKSLAMLVCIPQVVKKARKCRWSAWANVSCCRKYFECSGSVERFYISTSLYTVYFLAVAYITIILKNHTDYFLSLWRRVIVHEANFKTVYLSPTADKHVLCIHPWV